MYCIILYNLGGGFNLFFFHPYLVEMIQFDQYFSDGLVQPPTSSVLRARIK